jgi:hypothetical protein
MRLCTWTVLAATLAVVGVAFTAPVSAGAAKVKLCNVPAMTELATAGVTAPCTEKHGHKVFSGGRSEDLYAASWFVAGQEPKPQLTLIVERKAGPKRALAHSELQFLNNGFFSIGRHPMVGRHAALYQTATGTQMEMLWGHPASGHLYFGSVDLSAEPLTGSNERQHAAVTATIGKSVVAAFE